MDTSPFLPLEKAPVRSASELLRFRRREIGLLGIGIAPPIGAVRINRHRNTVGGKARMMERGITLLQFLIGAAIVAILAAISLPAFLLAMQNFRFRGAVDQVVGDIRRARALAVTQGRQVGIEGGFHVSAAPRQYRIELRCIATGPGCPSTLWPADSDTPSSNANVITLWQNVSTLYLGVTVSRPVDAASATLDRIIFNSLGNSVATTQNPISITVSNPLSRSCVLQVTSVGSVTRQSSSSCRIT